MSTSAARAPEIISTIKFLESIDRSVVQTGRAKELPGKYNPDLVTRGRLTPWRLVSCILRLASRILRLRHLLHRPMAEIGANEAQEDLAPESNDRSRSSPNPPQTQVNYFQAALKRRVLIHASRSLTTRS
jgi:hypothetical protein